MGIPQSESEPQNIGEVNNAPISNKDRVLEPFSYIANIPGKRFRIRLIHSLNFWFKLSSEDLEVLCKVMDILHNASLVIDDIEDGSVQRRGNPAAHVKYGVPLSINAANYAYFEALDIFMEHFQNFKGTQLIIRYMIQMHEGQGMEIRWRDKILGEKDILNVEIPTVEDYQDVIVIKTSGMFLFIAELFSILSKEAEQDVKEFCKNLGLYFQIRDDVMNLCSKEYEATKGFCEDIEEGKLSYPMIYALNLPELKENGKKQRLLEVLRMRTESREIKEEAVKILEDCGAMSYSKETLMELEDQILAEIVTLGGGNEMLQELFTKTLGIAVSFN